MLSKLCQLNLFVKVKFDILFVKRTKLNSTFSISQLLMDDYIELYCLDRNRNGVSYVYLRRYTKQTSSGS